MKKHKVYKRHNYRNIIIIGFLLLLLEMGIGFSIISASLGLFGNIGVSLFAIGGPEVIVKEVKLEDYSSANPDTVSINKINNSSFTTHMILGTDPNSFVVLKVTIKNESSSKQIFNTYHYDSSSYSNLNIAPSLSNINENLTVLEPNEETYFYVTFNYLDQSNITNRELTGTIDFHFTPMTHIVYSGLTNSNDETEEYIRIASYHNSNSNTTYYPTLNIGSDYISINDGTDDLVKDTDYTYNNGIVTFLNVLDENKTYTVTAVTPPETGAQHIASLIENVNPDTNGVYTGEAGDSCTNTFAYDGTADNNLRYVGANPCNYVKFNCDADDNCELWRIIGIMNDVDSTSTIKMVKSTLDYESTQWNNTANNVWLSSTLYNTLNTTYYNSLSTTSKELIYNTKWNIGGIENNWKVDNFYAKEHETKSDTEFNVGLFSPADYGYATDGGGSGRASCVSASLNSGAYSNTCRTNNWLYTTSYYQWTMIRRPSSANNQVYYITTAGLSAYSTVTSNSSYYNYRPCVYLSPVVTIADGDGSSTNPYVLGEKIK